MIIPYIPPLYPEKGENGGQVAEKIEMARGCFLGNSRKVPKAGI
jgi:hypothetical protein